MTSPAKTIALGGGTHPTLLFRFGDTAGTEEMPSRKDEIISRRARRVLVDRRVYFENEVLPFELFEKAMGPSPASIGAVPTFKPALPPADTRLVDAPQEKLYDRIVANFPKLAAAFK